MNDKTLFAALLLAATLSPAARAADWSRSAQADAIRAGMAGLSAAPALVVVPTPLPTADVEAQAAAACRRRGESLKPAAESAILGSPLIGSARPGVWGMAVLCLPARAEPGASYALATGRAVVPAGSARDAAAERDADCAKKGPGATVTDGDTFLAGAAYTSVGVCRWRASR
ncbi:MAG: hypothetical protein KGM24_14345 [Elusimicrobia bacterium]|nr:hypothetical protein [Elusimicrobiota bacterium]